MTKQPTLLLTRPDAQSARFAEAVRERLGDGLAVVVSPLIEVRPRAVDVAPEDFAALIFTSQNGVASFAAQSPLRDRPAWCVGDRTAEAARDAGFAQVHSASARGGDADALLSLLLESPPEGRLLHLRGAHARKDLARRLTESGLPCEAAVVYDQTPLPLSEDARRLLRGHSPVLLPLFSPRSAKLLIAAIGTGEHAPLFPVAISVATARVWRGARSEPVAVAARPDAEAMLDTLQYIVADLVP